MKEAGFTAIKEYPFKLPLGSWPRDPKMKEIGTFNLMMTDGSLEGFALYLFTRVLGWYRAASSSGLRWLPRLTLGSGPSRKHTCTSLRRERSSGIGLSTRIMPGKSIEPH